MAGYGELLKGVAAILWPIVAIILMVLFYRQLRELILSAKSRKFALKIGGQELSMEEATHQQQGLIADLQAQVVEIKKRLETEVPSRVRVVDDALPSTLSVLWVDDNPKNNSYFVQQLLDRGAVVDLAISTVEGLSRFGRRRYDVVISDMGRAEGAKYNDTAGIDLVKAIRSRDAAIPILVFCSSRAVRERANEALTAGATAITSSATELLAHLEQLRPATGA